jgi:hypothetical protein
LLVSTAGIWLITERGRFNAGFRTPSGQATNLHRTRRP